MLCYTVIIKQFPQYIVIQQIQIHQANQPPSSDPHHPHPLRVDHRCSSIRRTRRSIRESSLRSASRLSSRTILTLRSWGYRRCSDAWSAELRSRGHPVDRWRVEGGLLHGWDGAILRRERRGVGVGWSETCVGEDGAGCRQDSSRQMFKEVTARKKQEASGIGF